MPAIPYIGYMREYSLRKGKLCLNFIENELSGKSSRVFNIDEINFEPKIMEKAKLITSAWESSEKYILNFFEESEQTSGPCILGIKRKKPTPREMEFGVFCNDYACGLKTPKGYKKIEVWKNGRLDWREKWNELELFMSGCFDRDPVGLNEQSLI